MKISSKKELLRTDIENEIVRLISKYDDDLNYEDVLIILSNVAKFTVNQAMKEGNR